VGESPDANNAGSDVERATNASTHDSQRLVGGVPQEALTALAREIVSEAGLKYDAASSEARQAQQRDRLEAYRDAFKHLSTVGIAASVAVVALHRDLGYAPSSTLLVLGMFSASVFLALFGLVDGVLQGEERHLRLFGFSYSLLRLLLATSGTLLLAGVGTLLGFAWPFI
jgi:hypothetical protein